MATTPTITAHRCGPRHDDGDSVGNCGVLVGCDAVRVLPDAVQVTMARSYGCRLRARTSSRLPVFPFCAVVGVSALFPGSTDATGFWRDILAGSDLIRDLPETHWLLEDFYDADPGAPDKTYARRGAFLDPIDFDALGWGVPPSSIPATDTAQLLALVVAQQVLRDAAGSQFETMDRSRTTAYRRRRRTEKRVVDYSCEPLGDSRSFEPWSPGRRPARP
jgi:Beta-ketoacyl synthase, N-terminal domain